MILKTNKNKLYYEDGYHRETVAKSGTINGIDFAIVSYGTHPCCYVRVNKDSKFYGKNYDKATNMICKIHCPYGLFTFARDKLFAFEDDKDKWILGWDYAHSGDYVVGINLYGEKHTKKELFEEVVKVINAIKELEGE